MSFSSYLHFSSLHITAIVLSTLSCLLVIPVWITQRKSRHRHHALSFMLAWVLLGSILAILNEILLEPETFPFALFDPPSSSTPDTSPLFPGIYVISGGNVTTPRGVSIASNRHDRKHASKVSHPLAMSISNDTLLSLLSTSLSGWSTLQITDFVTKDVPDRAQLIVPLQFCVLSAHIFEALWLGSCLALMQWGWRLYRTVSREVRIDPSGLTDQGTLNDDDREAEDQFKSALSPTSSDGDGFAKSHQGSKSSSWSLVLRLLVGIRIGLGRCMQCILCCCCCCFSRRVKRVADLERGELESRQQVEGSTFGVSPFRWQTSSDDALGRQQQHEIDKRSCSSAAEDVCGSSEGGAGSTHGLTANASSLMSDPPPRTPNTLGAFFRASRLDKQRARYGRYHNFERKTFSLKDSRTGQLWDQCRRPGTTAQDLFVCFGLPLIAFLPLFFVTAEDRSYEVQLGWGGCRISTGSGHNDGSRLLALQVLITVMTFSGFLFACFAIQCFRKCSGLENAFKLDDLQSPTLTVPHKCKAASTVRRHLALCLCLSSMLLLSRIVHLGVIVYEFRTATMQHSTPTPAPTLTSPADGMTKNNFSTGSRPPLFRLADHDHGMFDVPIFFCLVVVSFLLLLWTQWVEWMKSAIRRCFPSAKDLQEMDDDEEISGRRSSNSTAMVPQQQQVRTTAHARESEFERDAEAASKSIDHEMVPLESSTLGAVGDITACGSSSTLSPIPKANLFQEGNELSSSNTSWWPVSSLAQDCSLTKAFRGGKMMGQYLQQSRRTASQTDLGLGTSPLLSAAPLTTWSAGGGTHGSPLQGGPLCIPRITVNGTEYDRVFEQLMQKTLGSRGDSGSSALAGQEDDEEEGYEIETMCPVSLEGLVYVDEDDYATAGGETGDRVMEVALADSSEIRGIDMGALSSFGRPVQMSSPTAAILHARDPPLPPVPTAAPPKLPPSSVVWEPLRYQGEVFFYYQ